MFTINTLTELFAVVKDKGDSFSFVIREQGNIASDITEVLRPYIIGVEVVSEWPGTLLTDGTAQLYTYHLNAETAFLMIKEENDLFEWLTPRLPEDIAVYEAGTPMFCSITHEKEAWFTEYT